MTADYIATPEALLAKGWHEDACRHCGRPVLTDGTSVVDPAPTDEGAVVIEARRGEPEVVRREDVVGRIPLWRAHFYTCADRMPPA